MQKIDSIINRLLSDGADRYDICLLLQEAIRHENIYVELTIDLLLGCIKQEDIMD